MGRIVCYALEDGALRSDLIESINKCLNDGVDECETIRKENETFRKIAEAWAVAIGLLTAQATLVAAAARLAARLAVTKAFRELMKKISDDNEIVKRELEDLLRRMRESEIILPRETVK